ncbi:MAG: hypothetical protein OEU09_18630 [Rhodospirillales bacterium]|nr:hypothetical protein [Rhodospirillales bacterium]MDH3792981.1 hypothetical protein [Rhodospirillales bacterium]MDH3913301.1 hypothetical protein [Rhodospirillales bacterium]MDH3916778.1 hypothetical protein [Rhodospirillales bacterium]MDH3969353.1 hypothetical protein [Rhodospirillales bacterium]
MKKVALYLGDSPNAIGDARAAAESIDATVFRHRAATGVACT